jgi:hypothetical protein
MKRIVLASVFVLLLAIIAIGAHAATTQLTYMPLVMNPPPTPTFTLTPTATPTPVVLPNGGFEQGHTIWHEVSSKGFEIIQYKDTLPVAPYQGSWAAWEGGSDSMAESIDQTVLVTAERPYLSYWRWIKSTDSCSHDIGKVMINNNTIDSFSLCSSTNTGKWVKVVYNLKSYAGPNVVLKISLTNDGNLPSSLFLDYFVFQFGQTLAETAPGVDLYPDELPLKSNAGNP